MFKLHKAIHKCKISLKLYKFRAYLEFAEFLENAESVEDYSSYFVYDRKNCFEQTHLHVDLLDSYLFLVDRLSFHLELEAENLHLTLR